MSYSDEKNSSYYSDHRSSDNKFSRSYDEHSTIVEREDEQFVIMSTSTRDDSKSASYSTYSTPFSPKIPQGMTLDLSLAAEAKHTRAIQEPDIQEEQLTIIFDLPDGSQGETNFKLGHTVEFVKSYVESEYGIPMMEQTLYLDDKILQNPFSLLDYPEVKGCDEVYVRVEGNLPIASRK